MVLVRGWKKKGKVSQKKGEREGTDGGGRGSTGVIPSKAEKKGSG